MWRCPTRLPCPTTQSRRPEQTCKSSLDDLGIAGLAFPYDDSPKSRLANRPLGYAIAGAVRSELVHPKGAIRLRYRALWTAWVPVPEAPHHLDCEAARAVREVRRTRQISVARSVSKPNQSRYLPNDQLWARARLSNETHAQRNVRGRSQVIEAPLSGLERLRNSFSGVALRYGHPEVSWRAVGRSRRLTFATHGVATPRGNRPEI